MALRVWLPLNGTLENKGISSLNTFSNNHFILQTNGKIGQCYSGYGIYHLEDEIIQNQWSLCAWICASSWSQYNDIILCKNISESTSCQFYFSIINGGQLNIGINGGSSSASYLYTFELNTWYHVAATYNGTNYTLYINGQQVKTGTVTTAFLTGMTNIGIGCRSSNATGTNSTGSGNKKLNDIRIYDHCLSAAEVREISQGLVLHYKLDSAYNEISQNLCTVIRPGTGNNVTWGGHVAQWLNYDATNDPVPFIQGTKGEIVYGQNGSTGGGASRSICTIAALPSTTYTYSCYIKSSDDLAYTHANFLYKYEYTAVSGGTKINEAGYFSNSRKELLGDGWYRIWGSFTTQSNTNCIVMAFYTYPKKNVNYWLGGWQIEQKDHVTPFMSPNTARNDTTVQDSSGYNNNGNSLNTVSLTSDTSRYSRSTNLPAANSMINCGRGGMVTDSITVNFWLKSSSWANPVSCTESGGWNFEASDTCFRFPVYITSVGYKYGKSTTTKAQICNNEWHMLTGIYDRINQKIQIYVDGQLDNDYATGTSNLIKYHTSNVIWLGGEATSSNTTGNNGMAGFFSDFRIYCTALSAEDILQLYHTSAKIDNKQNLHSFEFIENQSKINITKQGQTKCSEFSELSATKFKQDTIIESAELIEL